MKKSVFLFLLLSICLNASPTTSGGWLTPDIIKKNSLPEPFATFSVPCICRSFTPDGTVENEGSCTFEVIQVLEDVQFSVDAMYGNKLHFLGDTYPGGGKNSVNVFCNSEQFKLNNSLTTHIKTYSFETNIWDGNSSMFSISLLATNSDPSNKRYWFIWISKWRNDDRDSDSIIILYNDEIWAEIEKVINTFKAKGTYSKWIIN